MGCAWIASPRCWRYTHETDHFCVGPRHAFFCDDSNLGTSFIARAPSFQDWQADPGGRTGSPQYKDGYTNNGWCVVYSASSDVDWLAQRCNIDWLHSDRPFRVGTTD